MPSAGPAPTFLMRKLMSPSSPSRTRSEPATTSSNVTNGRRAAWLARLVSTTCPRNYHAATALPTSSPTVAPAIASEAPAVARDGRGPTTAEEVHGDDHGARNDHRGRHGGEDGHDGVAGPPAYRWHLMHAPRRCRAADRRADTPTVASRRAATELPADARPQPAGP